MLNDILTGVLFLIGVAALAGLGILGRYLLLTRAYLWRPSRHIADPPKWLHSMPPRATEAITELVNR